MDLSGLGFDPGPALHPPKPPPVPAPLPTPAHPGAPHKVFAGRIANTGEAFAAPAGQSLYASMAQAGLSWPVSCRNGTCRTCMAHLAAGSVVYDIAWPGLSLDEKREGYCLPCIARPASDVMLSPA